MKKKKYRRKITFEKKTSSLVWVRSDHGLTRRVDRVVAPASLLTNPDWFSHRVDWVPGRPVVPIQV